MKARVPKKKNASRRSPTRPFIETYGGKKNLMFDGNKEPFFGMAFAPTSGGTSNITTSSTTTVPGTIQKASEDGHNFPSGSIFAGNTTLVAVLNNELVVRFGDQGTHVRLIQDALMGERYALPVFGVDGIFGDETKRAIKAFQVDMGLAVDGVVGDHTIGYLDKRNRNVEVAPPVEPVASNTPFDKANAMVSIVQPLVPNQFSKPNGLTRPEFVDIKFDVIENGVFWQPVLREVVGFYSLQTSLGPIAKEVTGPGKNTTEDKYCKQIEHLDAGTKRTTKWFMSSAILAHERVHASFFRKALITPLFIDALERGLERNTLLKSERANSPAMAKRIMENSSLFRSLEKSAKKKWLESLKAVGAMHPEIGKAPHDAAKVVLNGMIDKIYKYASQNGWTPCSSSNP